MAKAKDTANEGDLVPDPETGELFNTDDATPRVKRAATEFRKARDAKIKAGATFNTKQENLITAMIEDQVPAVSVDMGDSRKVIKLLHKDKLAIENATKAPPAGE